MAAKKRHKDKSAMKAYSQFIANAKLKGRVRLSCHSSEQLYLEKHHIYPKCLTADDTYGAVLNGDNSKANLVLLTLEEHVQAHMLLAKVYPSCIGLQTAPALIAGGRTVSSIAEEAKATAALAMSRLQTGKAEQGLLYKQTAEGSEAQKQLAKDLASKGKLWFQTVQGKRFCSEQSYAKTEAGKLTMSNNGKNQAAKAYSCLYCCKLGQETGLSQSILTNVPC